METKKKLSFVYSDVKEPHRDRTKEILKKHPDVRNYIGKNPYTIFAIIIAVGVQFTLAYFLRHQSWWLVIVVAYFVGAFADHVLYVSIHECAHNLLFKKKAWNSWAGIFANTTSVVPSSVSFQRYHLKHHAYQGIYRVRRRFTL